MELNKTQREVACDFAHNIVLYAGAGTGKTHTVAGKVKEAIARGIRPEEILCLTFTIKACREMQEDILNACPEAEGVTVKTIHSFCLSLVTEEAARAASDYVSPAVADDIDGEELLSRLFSERLAYLRLNDFLKNRTKLGSAEALFSLDVEYLRPSGFFWRVPANGGGCVYLNSEAKYVAGQDAEDCIFQTLPEHVVCPACGGKQREKSNFCTECGFDFRTYIHPAHFKIKNYRTVVSAIRRHREMYGYYSPSPADDFQRTFERLQGERGFSALVSYWEKGKLVEDGQFLRAFAPHAGELVCEYERALRQSNTLDFDDLILRAGGYLKDKETLARWNNRYRFYVVDEMQDTSKLEYSLLKKLFTGNRVMVCGDLFQTIYEWRGSDPTEVLNDFKESFRAKTYSFSQNYRSTKMLVGAAQGYLKNTYPALADYVAESASGEEGERVRIAGCGSEEAEAEFIYRYLLAHPHDDCSKVCVMARSNRYIAKISRLLRAFGRTMPANERLRFFTVDEDFRFFKKPAVKDLTAFYTVLLNPYDRLSFERLALRHLDGVGDATLGKLRAGVGVGMSVASFFQQGAYKTGDAYGQLIEDFQNKNVVVYDIETTGLDVSSDEIVQISAVRTDGKGNVVAAFDRAVIPAREISEGAARTHGFTLEYLREHGGTSAREALTAFSEFVSGATLVGHNSVKFDRAVVNRQLKENGLAPLNVAGEYDTMFLAKQFLPDLKNYKLETLCALFGVVNERAHDAFSDVTATAKVLAALIEHKILPTALPRIALFERYADKFKPLAERYRAMKALLQANDLRGLNAYLLHEFPARDGADREAAEEFADVAQAAFEACGDAEACINRILSDASLSGSRMDLLVKKLNKIPVITVHQSKGCEFDTVVLAGADNRNFPSYPAVCSGNGEEEKRVFYVAISRARRRLAITYSDTARSQYGTVFSQQPSEYLAKFPHEFIKFSAE